MPQMNNGCSESEQAQQVNKDRRSVFVPAMGVREKLIIIFLCVKVLPLILLTIIAWQALISLGGILRKTAVTDSRKALTAMAVQNIERITTDAAQKVAEFLYQRDADISLLAKLAKSYITEEGTAQHEAEAFFADFGNEKTGLIRQYGHWKVAENGMQWDQTDPYIPPKEVTKRSVSRENEDVIDGTAFSYRPPFGFGDDPARFTSVPLYDEIALLDKDGKQIAKYISSNSTKTRFPFRKELLDVSNPENTFVKAERYFEVLKKMGKDDIYVSDVIGAYTPSRFIGMYTPDFMASKRIDSKIADLEKEADGKITDTSWQLRVLNAELKDDGESFNSHLGLDKKVRNEIDRRLGVGKEWKIEPKTLLQVSDDLKTLGLPELAESIVNIPFTPEKEAYAGAENPVGVRFEGIIRWAKPVLDIKGEVCGYVTFALNHDHLMEMIDHITPMPERYTELSDAFHGNYAFVWDYKCRSIVHPRHHSICGFNPETGIAETPWLESTLYNGMIAAGYDRAQWQEYIATLTDYKPWTATPDWGWVQEKLEKKEKWIPEEIGRLPLYYQGRMKAPAIELTKLGLVGLDGRYLNFAPQCTGWMDLTRDGGSGSFYILWSGLYKLTTAATIPYYTGQYSPEVQGNRRGFGFVAVGAGIDDFTRPANEMGEMLEDMVGENIQRTTFHLVWTTAVLTLLVIFIAIWMASYLSKKLNWLIAGITQFRRGYRDFRFAKVVRDEFGQLAHSFNEMADNIVHSVHTPLVITDMDLKVIYFNEHALKAIEKTRLEDVIGRSYKEISVYQYGSPYCPITALEEGRETKVTHLEKSNRYLMGVANYLLDERGEKQGYIITSNDVTELSLKQIELEKAIQEAELASQHKSRFLARMSHELRTPMNAIMGMNEITQWKIADSQISENQQELSIFLDDLKRSSLHLLGLLNEILEASNLESGNVSLVEKPLDLSVMLAEITMRMKPVCDEKGLEWETDYKLTANRFIADGLRLRQVLNHLLDNAVKFTPAGGKIIFSVEHTSTLRKKAKILFSVRDTGVGMPAETLATICNPFEQVDEHQYMSGGCGLGLTIVRRILQLFNSQLTIQSEERKGSEFSFDVWLKEEKSTVKVDFDSLKGCFTNQRALVVDDVHINRVVLVNFLKEVGFTTDEARNGQECLKIFENSPVNTYSVIFMDIQMPVMDGWEAAQVIRNMPRQDAKTIPIVTVSANAFDSDVKKSLDCGMDSHYAKPIQKDVLSEILTRYCKPSE